MNPTVTLLLIFMAATLANVGGQEEDTPGDGACSLIFASPRHGSMVRRDARTFQVVILLRGSKCEEKGWAAL